jgi:hypothetical protein
MCGQILQGNKLDGRSVGGFQNDRRRHSGIQRLLPSTDAKAPTISSRKARKAELRMGPDQVVPSRARKLQELRSHDSANGVQSNIAGTGSAKAITIKAGSGLEAAAL